MQNIVVLLREPPQNEFIEQMLEEWEGRIDEVRDRCKRVTVARGEALVHLDFFDDVADYDEKELEPFSSSLGARPTASVSVHFGGNDPSLNLAFEIARSVCGHLGGVIDKNP